MMFGLDQAEVIEWSVQATVALIAAGGLIIVALINTRRNRKTSENLAGEVSRIDTHETHIQSLEERTQHMEKRSMVGVTGLGVAYLWLVFITVSIIVDGIRAGLRFMRNHDED